MTQAEIEKLGLKCQRRGQAWAITGWGVSVLCADLRYVDKRDLQPFKPMEQQWQKR